jgi:hypothetical protein
VGEARVRLALGLAEFDQMPMPPIVQGSISSQTDIALQLVGCGSTDLHACHRRRFVPGMTRLHEGDQLLPHVVGPLTLLAPSSRYLPAPPSRASNSSSPGEMPLACLIQSQHTERYGGS